MRSRSRRRRCLFVLVALLLVVLAVEAIGWVGWWIATGAPFTWSRAASARAAVAGDDRAQPAARANMPGLVPHPYLGYVFDPTAPGQEVVSRFGLVGKSSPIRRRSPDKFVIGITGGSVSLLMCENAETELAAALARSPALGGRRVELVRLAVGGYKQPQQLFGVQLLTVLGAEFDCIVALDGVNEVGLVDENVPLGVPEWFPRSWARLLDAVPTPEQQRRLGHLVVLGEERADAAASAEGCWWSPSLQLLWLLRDRTLHARIAGESAAAERAAFAPSFAITGPGPTSTSLTEARAEMAKVWRRSSLALHELCSGQGTLYLHFLQPNQYVAGSKPIGEAEARLAIDPGGRWHAAVTDGYPLLQAEGKALVEAGVAFADLTGIFRDHPEPLYVDNCCHLNRDGYAILAEYVASAVRARLELGSATFVRIGVRPESVHARSPMTVERVLVFGVDASGVEHDITGAGFGTRLYCPVPDAWVVDGGGGLRATRRGRAELVVERGELRTVVPLLAEWPDHLDVPGGKAGPDGTMPRLETLDGGAPGRQRVQCSGLPVGSPRFLIAADRPIPQQMEPRFGLIGVRIVPLDGTTAAQVVEVDAPQASGRPLFLRCMAFSADLVQVTAASGVVVLTRG